MNNYIALEITEFEKKLNGYNMLFNYRMANLCVKADPTAMLPVTVVAGNAEYNIEEVADAIKPDDYTFHVYPKNQNNLRDIVDGVFDVHPEFKMEIKSEKQKTVDGNQQTGEEEIHYIVYTMPEVDKNRHDLLNETTKTFHKECRANLDAAYARQQTKIVEPLSMMTPIEADEARKGFEKLYNDAKKECDQLLQAKLQEIEEGYQRYLEGKTAGGGNTDGGGDGGDSTSGMDVTKGMKLTSE